MYLINPTKKGITISWEGVNETGLFKKYQQPESACASDLEEEGGGDVMCSACSPLSK